MAHLWNVVIVVIVAAIVGRAEAAGGCKSRNFGHGSVVCVCDSSHCDELAPIKPDKPGEALIVTSSKSGARWSMQYTTFSDFSNEITPSGPDLELEINSNEFYQEIIGFGGAFTDAAGLNILSLPDSLQDEVLRAYYSDTGLEYSMGRVPIGGTDFSTRPYTYDDLKPGETDPTLAKFALAPEDLNYKIPLIQRAAKISQKPIKLFGSAWGAPAWMKNNGKIWGKGKLNTSAYSTWANYHVKFLESYAKHNISFWGLTTQNEPTDGLVKNFQFNAVGWSPQDQAEWIGKHLGPALKNHSLSSVKIMIMDDNRLLLPKWVEDVMANKEAQSYVSGVGIHWYLDFVTPALALDLTHERYPDLFMLYTEACTGQWPWQPLKVVLGSWVRAEDYASDIIENLQHWVSGWTDWNLALDVKGGPNWAKNNVDSPIIVNAPHKEFYKQPMYYALAHFTKALPEGSRRIDLRATMLTDSVSLPVYRVAFAQPDNTIVLFIVNRYHSEVQMRIKDKMLGQFDMYVDAHTIMTIAWKN
ncbi:lysosomal acid glucosylceramidase [Penaeus vannamei]|uniref:lysosomal acid glucosylceramidase n=1 Tax=Penaeus vannamei TaxID=6689 RepID=UPI000F659204|nr:glucosylceramidase-like [Penaeus vannamei]